MEIFDLPLDTTHLRHHLKWMSQVLGVSFKQYHRKVQEVLNKYPHWARRRRISRLFRMYGHLEQRTQEWHLTRSERITASECTAAFKGASKIARYELIMRKLFPQTNGDGTMGAACLWGTHFEPVAKQIYCAVKGGGTIADTSCVVHPVHKFIGASPDGIYLPSPENPEWGQLLEIKCPISRVFDDTSPVPPEYYHQMQMQMACCDIWTCDFVEMKFSKTKKVCAFNGCYKIYDDGHIEYGSEEHEGECRVVWWGVEQYRIKKIARDPAWLDDHIQEFSELWTEVLEHRKNGTSPSDPRQEGVLRINLPDDLIPVPAEAVPNRGVESGLSTARTTKKVTLRIEM